MVLDLVSVWESDYGRKKHQNRLSGLAKKKDCFEEVGIAWSKNGRQTKNCKMREDGQGNMLTIRTKRGRRKSGTYDNLYSLSLSEVPPVFHQVIKMGDCLDQRHDLTVRRIDNGQYKARAERDLSLVRSKE